MHTSVQVDQYIFKSSPFAIPILEHLRSIVHRTDARIEETIKWGMPFFEFKGPVCHMGAFKNHCVFGFWKGALIQDDLELFKDKTNAMGLLGKIKSFADLPADEVLMAYISQAIQLNEDGVKLPPKPKKAENQTLEIPPYFINVLQENPAALAVFQDFSPSNKKDYILWLREAKTESTRQKRLDTAIEWISEGKTRMWKYKK